MNEKPEKEVSYLSPLKRICMTIGELPSSYLETMTYYEMLVWFTKFLQERVIPTIDNNALAVDELQKLFIELQKYVNDYFDNLDVQEEINNKLDEMLEDGVLSEIIQQFLQSSALWCFDNVESMKQATNLIDGSYARTLGYYEANDGGNALYKIRTITNEDVIDEMTIIALSNNTLIAELIIEDICSPETFGAKGNGETDDTNAIRKALSSSKNIIFKNKNYYSQDIEITEGSVVNFEDTTLTRYSVDYDVETGKATTFVTANDNVVINGNVTIDGRKGELLYNDNILGFANGCHNIKLGNNTKVFGNIHSKRSFTCGVRIDGVKNVYINSIESETSGDLDPDNVSHSSDGVAIYNSKNVIIDFINAHENGRNGLAVFSYNSSTSSIDNELSGDCIINYYIGMENQLKDVDLEGCSNVVMNKIGQLNDFISVTCNNSKNLKLSNLYGSVYGSGVNNINVENVIINNTDTNYMGFYLSGSVINVRNVLITDTRTTRTGISFQIVDNTENGLIENLYINKAYRGYTIKSANIRNTKCDVFSVNSAYIRTINDTDKTVIVGRRENYMSANILHLFSSDTLPPSSDVSMFKIGDKFTSLNANASQHEYFFNGTSWV